MSRTSQRAENLSASLLSTCSFLIKTVEKIGTGVSVYSWITDVWESVQVFLLVYLCCLSPNTVILQEHSNCPIHRPRGPFIAPMTNRSILQHQRCQLPLFKQTIRRRVRWQGWTMLEMTVPGLSLPLSPTFSVCYSWCWTGQRSEPLWAFSQSPKFHYSLLLPVDVLVVSQHFLA